MVVRERVVLLLVLLVLACLVPRRPRRRRARPTKRRRVRRAANRDSRTPGPTDDAIPPENDWDCDEVANERDNCPTVRNHDQSDVDRDGFGDRCDETPTTTTTTTSTTTARSSPTTTGTPRACMVDTDGDGIMDPRGQLPAGWPNPDQTDTDRDSYGDACEGDDDDDYDLDSVDNCPLTPNPDQADADRDGVGDACDPSTAIVGPSPATRHGRRPRAETRPARADAQGPHRPHPAAQRRRGRHAVSVALLRSLRDQRPRHGQRARRPPARHRPHRPQTRGRRRGRRRPRRRRD